MYVVCIHTYILYIYIYIYVYVCRNRCATVPTHPPTHHTHTHTRTHTYIHTHTHTHTHRCAYVAKLMEPKKFVDAMNRIFPLKGFLYVKSRIREVYMYL